MLRTKWFNHNQVFLCLLLMPLFAARVAFAQGPGTAFTFQGKLGDAGTPINNSYDMQFKLFNGPDPGKSLQVGTTITMNNPLVQVTNGVFTVELDFGDTPLSGSDRYLEIGIRQNSNQTYTVLSPRTKITSTPYAVRSRNATSADSLSSTGSSSFIQNTTTQQASSNFNISGDGGVGHDLAVQNDAVVGNNASITNNANVSGFASIGKDASITGNATINKNANIIGNANILGNALISGTAVISQATIGGPGGTTITRDVTVGNDMTISRNASIGGSATITGNTTVSGNLVTNQDSTIAGSAFISQNTAIGGDVKIGPATPTAKLTVSGSGLFSDHGAPRFDLINTSSNRGFSQYVTATGFWQLATSGGSVRMYVDPNGNLGISTSGALPNTLQVGGTVGLKLGSGGTQSLCLGAGNTIASCSSSIRYKTNLNSFGSGLDLIRRLRPVSFNWKQGGMPDFGLVAEEVAKVEPLLVTHNDKGEVEGVKYDRVGVVLINAVKEQQAQIESQQKQIEEQQQAIKKQKDEIERQNREIQGLKQLVCSQNATASICLPKN